MAERLSDNAQFHSPRPSLWHDARRDWQSWTGFERVAAPLILLVLLAASFRGLWLGV
jgi:hypothetical protein